jgi:hypothetical protein
MIGFLVQAFELSKKAERVLDHGAGTIVRQSTQQDWDRKGDEIPFETTK